MFLEYIVVHLHIMETLILDMILLLLMSLIIYIILITNLLFFFLNFWKTELLLTIDAGQYLFDDQEAYKEWKNCLEEWLSSTTEALRVEVNSLLGTIPQLDSIIPCCKLVRQKAIDTKFFLYQLDWQKSGYTPSIIWTVTAKSYEN